MNEESRAPETAVEVPAPTAWPMIAALGVTLLLAGLVTHALVSATGLVLLIAGGAGWFREVLPRENTGTVAAEPAPAVAAAPVAVLRLAAGEMRHRVRYPVEIYPYSAGIKGGLAGGVAMALLACLYGLAVYASPWVPVNLLAASASATLAAASPAELAAFSTEGLVLATLIHVVMSLLVGLLYGVLLPMFPWHPMAVGGTIAPLAWTGLLWAAMRVVDPSLAARIDWWWFLVSQIGFGIAAGVVVIRSEKIATLQHLPLAMRAGVEGSGLEPADGGEGEG